MERDIARGGEGRMSGGSFNYLCHYAKTPPHRRKPCTRIPQEDGLSCCCVTSWRWVTWG